MMLNQTSRHGLLIAGSWHISAAGIEVVNPATAAVVGEVSDASEAELDAAINAARKAFPPWAATPIDERRAALIALADAMLTDADIIAAILTAEQGKPLAEAKVEVQSAARWLTGTAKLDLLGKTNEDSADRVSETRHIPLGVVAGIPAWNFPLFLAALKIAPALLAGNTIVLKPSPFTPLSTLAVGRLANAILPAGVLNIVTGGDQLGPQLTAHPGIDKIAFTGSNDTGRKVMASAAASLKSVTLELGGNDAAIVLPDVDLEIVIPKLFWAAFRNNGQVCTAVKRLYVHDFIFQNFVDAFVDYARTVVIGNGADTSSQIGPLSNRLQYKRVLAMIEDCRTQGLHVITTHSALDHSEGLFVAPTLVIEPPESSRIVQEEQFGPILPILRFDSIEDVVARANATEFGLSGSVWSADESAAFTIAERLAVGTIWVNHLQYLAPDVPFGGMKMSGFGVEGGVQGLEAYTAARTIVRGRI